MRRWLKAAVVLVLALALIAAFVGCANSVGPEVTFPDSNLEEAVREAIGKPLGKIHTSDLKGLTSLTASKRKIADLAGLEHCTSLTELILGDNEIKSVAPLADLTGLTILVLSENQISDLSPLASILRLRELQLWGNQIADIAPLARLPSLTSLDISGNRISDIASVFKVWLA